MVSPPLPCSEKRFHDDPVNDQIDHRRLNQVMFYLSTAGLSLGDEGQQKTTIAQTNSNPLTILGSSHRLTKTRVDPSVSRDRRILYGRKR